MRKLTGAGLGTCRKMTLLKFDRQGEACRPGGTGRQMAVQYCEWHQNFAINCELK